MRKLLILSAALITLVGCGRDVTGPGLMGGYHLVAVNGSLPAVITQTATATDEIVSGNAFLIPDGTWEMNVYHRVTMGSSVAQQYFHSGGTWTESGNGFTFRDGSDGSLSAATVNDGRLTVVKGAFTFVYQQDGSGGFCNRCL